VSNNEIEGGPSSSAKADTVQSNLNICIIIDELYILFKTPEIASSHPFDCLPERVVSSNCISFLGKVFENGFDHFNNCNQEWSECKRSQMVSEWPNRCFQYTCIRSLVTFVWLVPLAANASNNESLDSKDECYNPEKSEEHNPKHFFDSFLPLDVGYKTIFFEFGFTTTVYKYNTYNPPYINRNGCNVSNDWQ